MVLTYAGLKVPTRTLTDTVSIVDPNIYVDRIEFGTTAWKPRVKVTNNEGQLLYFQLKPRPGAVQPPRYTINTTNLGPVSNGAVVEFTNYDGIQCLEANAPGGGDIPSGSTLPETCYLRLEAYTTDPSLPDPISFGYADLDITITWIDSSSGGWTVVADNDFDDGTVQGWSARWVLISGVGSSLSDIVDGSVYRSPPYSYLAKMTYNTGSMEGYLGQYKNFTIGSITRAFAVLYFRTSTGTGTYYSTQARVGGTVTHQFARPTDATWFKVVVPLPLNATSELELRHHILTGGMAGMVWAANLDSVKVLQS